MVESTIFGDRYLGVRELPWRGLGTVIEAPIPMAEAIALAGLDYTVETHPLFFFTKPATEGAYLDKYVVESGKVAIVRPPTKDDEEWRVLGTASPTYEVLQNTQIADLLEPLSIEWPLTAVGALGYGENTFFVLHAGEDEVKGEHIQKYLLLLDDKTGGGSLKCAVVPIRTHCLNTLTMGLNTAMFSAAINHIKGAQLEADFRVKLIAQAKKAEQATMAALRRFSETPLSKDEVVSIIEAAYPMPKKPKKVGLFEELNEGKLHGYEVDVEEQQLEKLMKVTATYDYYQTRVHAFREGALELFDRFNDEFPDTANTAWAAYNAVVECSDYRKGGKNVSESLMFGDRSREKRRAFQTAMHLVSAAS